MFLLEYSESQEDCAGIILTYGEFTVQYRYTIISSISYKTNRIIESFVVLNILTAKVVQICLEHPVYVYCMCTHNAKNGRVQFNKSGINYNL